MQYTDYVQTPFTSILNQYMFKRWIKRNILSNKMRTITFISIHWSYWSQGFRRLFHGLLCWLRFRELWRIWQRRLRGRGRRFLSCNRCSLIGHGACGDPYLAAALAVGSLPATRRVLLLSVLVLPTVTLVFVLANVPVVLERETQILDRWYSKYLFPDDAAIFSPQSEHEKSTLEIVCTWAGRTLKQVNKSFLLLDSATLLLQSLLRSTNMHQFQGPRKWDLRHTIFLFSLHKHVCSFIFIKSP